VALRVGVIGCGAVTHYCHLPALARISRIRVVALADEDPRALERVQRRARRALLLAPDELLDRGDVDAVLVATPSHMHAGIAERVLAAGKHLYLEKPVAISAAEATSLRDATARARGRVAVGFNRRLHPIYQLAADALRRGVVGTVRGVQTVFAERVEPELMPYWKRARTSGGGALLDLASHHVDLVRWLLRQDVSLVTATLASHRTEHDVASIACTLTDGTLVQSLCSFRSSLADTIELHGERGVLRMDRHRQTVTITMRRRIGYGTRTTTLTRGVSDALPRLRRAMRPSRDPSYEAAWRAFADLVDGTPTTIASMSDGLASLAVILAAESSVMSGVPTAPAQY
jgi:predicted dehydrogenase